MKIRDILTVGLALMIAGSVAGQTAAAGPPKELVDQAKREGEVVFFTGTARYPQSAATKLGTAFESKYGFPMKVTFAAIGPHPTVVQKLVAEASSGVRPAADLFPTALSFQKVLREGGVLEPVNWTSLGAPADAVVASENAVLLNIIARNIVYNTNLVKGADVPRRLEDLADPKWRGRIVAPAIGDAFAMMVPVLGEAKTEQLVKTLVAEQKIALVQSITDVATKVASGEFALGFGVPADWTGTKSKGAPIANAPMAKVSGQPFYASVLKNSEHPAAAKLLGHFLCCTAEGQRALNDALGWSKFETTGTEAFEIGGEGRGIYPSIQFQLNDQRRVSSELGKLLSQ